MSAGGDVACHPFRARGVVARLQGPGRDQQGSSLIEVLVAMLLSAIGLLGLAGALTNSIGLAKMGEHRASASLLAGDIADRMRANDAAWRAGDYQHTPDFAATQDPPATDCAPDAACAPAVLAAQDLAEWSTRVRRMLPSGSGYVVVDAEQGIADVWVAWLDPAIGLQPKRPPAECPAAYAGAQLAPRCLHLRVAL